MNIAISGVPGSGKGTVCKLLDGEVLSAGDIFRDYAQSKGLDVMGLNHSNTDEVDNIIEPTIWERSAKSTNLIVDARFSAKFTQNAFKVFIWCDPHVAASRIYNDSRGSEKYSSINDCLRANLSRVLIEQKRGIDKYLFDMLDMSVYDLVIDSTYLSPKDIAATISSGTKGILLSPSNILPTQEFGNVNMQLVDKYYRDNITDHANVKYHNLLWYVISGHHKILAANKMGRKCVRCELDSHAPILSCRTVHDYEVAANFKYETYPNEINNFVKGGQIKMTERELDIKKLLFGNQKQANAINDSVVKIVSEYFYTHESELTVDGDLATKMYTMIQNITAGERTEDYSQDLFLQLVCGPESFATWESGVPFIVTADQPSTESPKYNFRIYPLGAEVPEEKEEDTSLHIAAKPLVGPDEVYDDKDDFPTRARKIKDAILPMVPESVKKEIDNEYAQALCCAEYFYSNVR